MEERIRELEEENLRLKAENESISETLNKTKVHLKRYTAPVNRKEYYEKNKEEYIRRAKEYRERTNYKPTQEQKKEYNRNAYLRRKEKLNNGLDKEEKKDDI
jgi:hypothetical protein